MADAILRIYPDAQLTIGPVVEDGFYYDIYFPENSKQKITPESFSKIEQEMQKIVKRAHPFQRCEVSYDEANEHYARYKAIDGEKQVQTGNRGRYYRKGESLSFYQHGEFIVYAEAHVPPQDGSKASN